jgi:hypothetical protein
LFLKSWEILILFQEEKKMKRKSVLVLAVFSLLLNIDLPNSIATTTQYYNDGGVHQLSANLGDTVNVAVDNDTTLTVLSGAVMRSLQCYDGYVGMAGGITNMGVTGYGTSEFVMTDGILSNIYGNDSSFHDYAQAVINDGLVKRGIQTYDNSQLYVNGGEILTGLLALQDSQIFIKGGTIAASDGQITSRGGNADVFIYGTGFNYGYGEISDLSGILTGTLLNGDTINCWFYREDESGDMNYGTITLVPIPSAVILGTLGLTFSGWLLKRKGMA